ncbi:hypothetical protein CASFOL_023263 [Castilleja foliolosa]|uniref:Gnk2-homologous domain-containing protein n=1 Tax=Castilleja foliolosa TaxID=1961234 RepID=A0ABD3CM01_9LAMI
MGYLISIIPQLLLILMIIITCFSVDADMNLFLGEKCFGSQATYSTVSQALLNELVDHAPRNNGFSYASTLEPKGYGLASCRGDLNETCRSGTDFVGKMDFNNISQVYSAEGPATRYNISDSITRFLEGTADAAAANRTCNYRGAQLYNPTENVTIYGMSQCGLDIDPEDCRTCLGLAIGHLSMSTIWGKVVAESDTIHITSCRIIIKFSN